MRTALVVVLLASAAAPQQRPQVPGAIRSTVVLVPVDVRVIDRDGNPVTGLTQDDFTVLENGVPQRIGHFSTQSFADAVPETLPEGPSLRSGPGLEASPVKRRTFLFILGRGRLQHPAKGLDAVREFIRDRALPTDLIALQAYGRMTDFTSDRAALLRFVDRYEAEHERFEAMLNHWFSGPWMFDLQASPGIEQKIEAFFRQPGLPRLRRLPMLDLNGETPYEAQRREAREAQAFTATGRVPERDFVYEPAGADDTEKLYSAIEYLRYFEGEKHIVYLSEKGLIGGRGVDAMLMGARAADARVTVSTIRTGGVETSWRPGGRHNTMVFTGPPTTTFFANSDARHMAAQTGGVASAYKWASQTVDALDRATRFQYVLGYYPADTRWDGRQRRIEVRVNRRGVTVLNRGSYFAREELVPFDRRAFLTHSRITAAGAYRVRLTDVRVDVAGTATSAGRGAWRVSAQVTIDPGTIQFAEVGGRHVASLDVAVFAGARNQRPVGEIRKRIDLNLESGTYARAMSEGIRLETSIDLTSEPRYLKAVVYDYAADKLGSAVVDAGRATSRPRPKD